MHVHLFVHSRLLSKAHASALHHTEDAVHECNRPCNPVECADGCACARDVADLNETMSAFFELIILLERMMRHTVPKQILSLKNTASAMKPPNQNNMVNISSARMPYFAAVEVVRCEKRSGRTTSGTSARIVHDGAKMRKLTSLGEDCRQCVDHHDETAREM